MWCEFRALDDRRRVCDRCGQVVTVRGRPERRIIAQCQAVDLAKPIAAKRGTCRHLGEEVGRRECETCQGRWQIKEFACSHPSHAKTTRTECQACPDFTPIEAPPPATRTLLLRFWHGLGDHIQLGVVLRHLKAAFPEWAIDLACHAERADGLLTAGLCRAIVPPDQMGGYDQVRSLFFWEPDASYPDSPSTKAEKCLRDIFKIPPRPELCDYVCDSTAEQDARAKEFARRYAPFVLAHANGHSARSSKDLPLFAIEAAARDAKSRGREFLLLDLDGRGGWSPDAPLIPLRADDQVWGGPPTAGQLAAIARQAELCIGIDSGPGKVFSASGTPTIVCWSGMHPIHYHAPDANAFHLVPRNHEQHIRGAAAAGLAALKFFTKHYRHRVMSRNIADELPSQLKEHLCR